MKEEMEAKIMKQQKEARYVVAQATGEDIGKCISDVSVRTTASTRQSSLAGLQRPAVSQTLVKSENVRPHFPFPFLVLPLLTHTLFFSVFLTMKGIKHLSCHFSLSFLSVALCIFEYSSHKYHSYHSLEHYQFQLEPNIY